MTDSIDIPNKSSFKINEVCALTGVKSYVLRFWELEFPEIAPEATDEGLKLYAPKDIETILKIKRLLFIDKLTIERAKEQMRTHDTHYLIPPHHKHEELSNKRVFSEKDGECLLAAKTKLETILSWTKAIQKKKNW